MFGADLLGPFPAELQSINVVSAGIVTSARSRMPPGHCSNS
jgi:hypothetical protein